MLAEFNVPPDFSSAYPSYRDEYLRKAEESTEARLAIRTNTINDLQNANDTDTQACLVDLLTQLSDTAGWWIPPPSSDPQQLKRYKSVLDIFQLNDTQIQELFPQEGTPVTAKSMNPSLRNDPEDAYMQLAAQTAIFVAGFATFPGIDTSGLNTFLVFIRQNPEALADIKKLCLQAYEDWDNLSAPRIPEYIAYVANQHKSSQTPLTSADYADTWDNHRSEIIEASRDYPINTYSPKTPRHQFMFEKTLTQLQDHNLRINTVGDFGSGVTFGPLANLTSLIKARGLSSPETIYAYDLIPEQFAERKDIDGTKIVYNRQDISSPTFTSSAEPPLDFAMSMSVLPHLRSGKRIEIIKGMLRKSPAILFEGSIYGRNYWNEENPQNLLPRSPKSEHNGWLFIKNQRGGLDFTPLTSIPATHVVQ